MSIKIEPKEVADFLFEYLDLADLRDKYTGLKEFDWNPFDEDDDDYETPWEEIKHNWDILWEVIIAFAATVERITVGGYELTNREKHKVVKEALDRAINLPWYLEPFDGIVLDMLIKSAAEFIHNVSFDDEDYEQIELTEWKEIG